MAVGATCLYNTSIWLSLRTRKLLCMKLALCLCYTAGIRSFLELWQLECFSDMQMISTCKNVRWKQNASFAESFRKVFIHRILPSKTVFQL
jgi:hypothetical protein